MTVKFVQQGQLPVINVRKKATTKQFVRASQVFPSQLTKLRAWEKIRSCFSGRSIGESNYSWSAHIGVNGHNTQFKLDTGASVCMLSDQVPWLEGITLEKPQQTLRGPGDPSSKSWELSWLP
jgi:predicted aspartyl protease